LVQPVTKTPDWMEPLEVTRGEVQIGRELSTLQLLMKEWFYTCCLIGVFTFFVCELVGMICLRMILDVYRRQRMHDDASIGLNLSGSFGDTQDYPANGRATDFSRDEWEDLPPPSAAVTFVVRADNDEVVGDESDVPAHVAAGIDLHVDTNTDQEQTFSPLTAQLSPEE
jgi:hypothetical protein